MSSPPADLRSLIADVVREVVADISADTTRQALAARQDAPSGTSDPPPPATAVSGAEYVTPPDPRHRVEKVRIGDDADLDKFVRHLLALFENPKNRQDLRSGRLRFRLDGSTAGAAPSDRPVLRIDRGAVTERQIADAADNGQRVVLGRRAVLTPLGREKARALGVPFEKER